MRPRVFYNIEIPISFRLLIGVLACMRTRAGFYAHIGSKCIGKVDVDELRESSDPKLRSANLPKV